MRAIRRIASENSVFRSVATGAKENFSTYRVSAQEQNIYAGIASDADVVEHLLRPILVVSDGKECFAAQQSFGVLMCVDIRHVGDVVAFLLHPEAERMFP